MQQAINLKITERDLRNYENSKFSKMRVNEKTIFLEDYEKNIKDMIVDCITIDNTNNKCILNANKLKDFMYPNIDADIFLSHSHNDLELARKIANVIKYQTGKKVFIDSLVWENMYDLENHLNDKFSVINSDSNGYIYNYNKTKYIASHVRMLLTTALGSIIRKTKYFVVLNTGRSFINEAVTNSPWIYFEIFQATQYMKDTSKEALFESMEIEFDYNVEDYIKHFKSVNLDCLISRLKNENKVYY